MEVLIDAMRLSILGLIMADSSMIYWAFLLFASSYTVI